MKKETYDETLRSRILETLALGAARLTDIEDLKRLVRIGVRDIMEPPSEKTWSIVYNEWGNQYNHIFYNRKFYR